MRVKLCAASLQVCTLGWQITSNAIRCTRFQHILSLQSTTLWALRVQVYGLLWLLKLNFKENMELHANVFVRKWTGNRIGIRIKAVANLWGFKCNLKFGDILKYFQYLALRIGLSAIQVPRNWLSVPNRGPFKVDLKNRAVVISGLLWISENKATFTTTFSMHMLKC